MIKRISLSILSLGLAACGHDVPEPAQPEEPALNTITVQAESLAAVMPVEGNVEARHRAVLSTRMMARVMDILVEVGDGVRAGQTLIRLGTDDIAANRAKAEAAVRAAQAARDEAVKHAARMDTLYNQDAVARVHRDQAYLQLTQAESGLAMAQATLSEVEAANRYASIKAPFDGSVVLRYINEGDLAAPGMPLIVVDAHGPREAVIAVPTDVAGRLSIGSGITVTTTDGLRTVAEVRAVASGADPMTRTVQVRAVLPSDWPTGISLTALVPSGTKLGVAVPERAIVRRGQLTGVRVLTPAGELIRWVRLGRTVEPIATGEDRIETRVEVLSGLEPGERVVL
jgi:RND family efflux transporter MFP subunit